MSGTPATLTMPMLALRGLTVFPNMVLHFDVGRQRSVSALDNAMHDGQLIFLASQKDVLVDEPTESDVFEIGTVSRIRQIFRLPGDSARVLVEGLYRARRVSVVTTEPSFTVEVLQIAETDTRRTKKATEALMRRAREVFEEYAENAPRLTPDVSIGVASAKEAGYLADYIAQNIPIPFEKKQVVLEISNRAKRLEQVISMLEDEAEILELEADIHNRVRDNLGRTQREYYLREQMRIIKDELGEGRESEDGDDYRTKIKALKLDAEWTERLNKEVARLDRMHPSSAESAVIRSYLDTVLELPWHKHTNERTDIARAAKTLDADHFGLEKVKERILEFIAVRTLAPDIRGQVICLVGPPGVGKTSIAMSLARAMNRKIARLSLGGVHDEAEIRGHRKTYVGAMPGRIMTAVRQAGSKNAIILLDEIDKLGSDFRGDPSAALLEVLDAEQNSTFRDHYLEIPFDLSEVLFITTANSTDTIPRPLLDRMELIEIGSYTDEEKLQIVKRHLLPKQVSRHGLTRTTFRITDDALREVIACYTRESGVRTLERELAALCRKAARKIASGEVKKVAINAGSLESYLGPRHFKPEKPRRSEVGVVCGLAWTQVGGEILEVEVGAVEGGGKLELTGNLGDVMKESAKAAITYIRSVADNLGIDTDFHNNHDIHVHFPEGAIPKDGPSAGVTMATAIVSALTGRAVRGDVAMTGEITLRGRVLPIGGLKEKTMAAYRSGIKTVIIPADNESDLVEIDQTVRKALNFVTVETADNVFAIALEPPAEVYAKKSVSAKKRGRKSQTAARSEVVQ